MASKAFPLLCFLLIFMLLISIDAKEEKKEETKTNVDQWGRGDPYPGRGGGYPDPGRGGGYPYPGRGGGYPYPGRGGGYPYPGGGFPPRGRPCRYSCCNRYRRRCGCCTKKEFMASAEGQH